MNRRLLFKLLPVAALAAIGVFLGATNASKVDANITGLTPVTFTATSGTAQNFSFSADQLTGNITVSGAATGATVSLTASCTGCTFSGQGGSTVIITPPPVIGITSIFGVAISLTCTNSTLATTPVTLTATQGTSSVATGTCVGSTNCVNALLSGCCDLSGLNTGLFLNSGCGCFNGLNTTSLLINNGCGCFNGLNSSSLLLNNGCGCFGGFNGLSTVTLGNQLFGGNGCGCFNGFGNTALTLNNCGCVSGFQSTALLANCGCVGGINNGLVVGNTNFGIGTNNFGFGTNNFGFGQNFVNNNNCTANQVSVTVPGSATCGSTTNVLVSVRNTINGIALDGTPVVISSTMGSISPTQTFTSGGIASATLLLPANAAGTATISAAATGLTGSASIVVSCNVVPVAPAPIVLPAPIATAPIVITGPNTGDGGCFVNVCTE